MNAPYRSHRPGVLGHGASSTSLAACIAAIERTPNAWLSRWQVANEKRIRPVASRRLRMMRVESCTTAASGRGMADGAVVDREVAGIALCVLPWFSEQPSPATERCKFAASHERLTVWPRANLRLL